jgi:hypothetical protein
MGQQHKGQDLGAGEEGQGPALGNETQKENETVSDKKDPSLQDVANFEQSAVKEWQNSLDAMDSCTFHGRYAESVANLKGLCKLQVEEHKKRLDAAIDKVKHPMATFGRPAEGIGAPQAGPIAAALAEVKKDKEAVA